MISFYNFIDIQDKFIHETLKTFHCGTHETSMEQITFLVKSTDLISRHEDLTASASQLRTRRHQLQSP